MSDNRLPDGSFYRFPFGLRGFGFFTRVPNRPHILNEKFPPRPAATTFSRTTTHEPGASFRVASPAFPLCWYWFHHLFSRTELSFIHESSPSPLGVVSKSSDRHRFRTRWRSLPPNSSRVLKQILPEMWSAIAEKSIFSTELYCVVVWRPPHAHIVTILPNRVRRALHRWQPPVLAACSQIPSMKRIVLGFGAALP